MRNTIQLSNLSWSTLALCAIPTNILIGLYICIHNWPLKNASEIIYFAKNFNSMGKNQVNIIKKNIFTNDASLMYTWCSCNMNLIHRRAIFLKTRIIWKGVLFSKYPVQLQWCYILGLPSAHFFFINSIHKKAVLNKQQTFVPLF